MHKSACGHLSSWSLPIFLITELLDHMVSLCVNFSRNCQTFPKWEFYIHTSFLRLCQHLLLAVFLISVIFVYVNWYFIVVLKYISLLTNDVEHLFISLLVICTSSLMECLFKSFAHFLLGGLSIISLDLTKWILQKLCSPLFLIPSFSLYLFIFSFTKIFMETWVM